MSSLSRNLSDRIGSLGYLLDEKDSNGVNKAFLANTIRDVESHNRREQIDACWRAHRLQKMIGSKRQRDDDEVNCSGHSPNKRRVFPNQRIDDPIENHTNEREKWALKKLQAFSNIPPSAECVFEKNKREFSIQRQQDYDQLSSSGSSTSSSMSASSQSSESSRGRKHKKDKRSKKKRSSSSKKREKNYKKDKKDRSKKKKKDKKLEK